MHLQDEIIQILDDNKTRFSQTNGSNFKFQICVPLELELESEHGTSENTLTKEDIIPILFTTTPE